MTVRVNDLDTAIRAKLASWGEDPCGYATCVVVGWSEMRAAIVAVLDLHPEEDGHCGTCVEGIDIAWGSPVTAHEPYPCREVREIAEKLGVEAQSG